MDSKYIVTTDVIIPITPLEKSLCDFNELEQGRIEYCEKRLTQYQAMLDKATSPNPE